MENNNQFDEEAKNLKKVVATVKKVIAALTSVKILIPILIAAVITVMISGTIFGIFMSKSNDANSSFKGARPSTG